MADEIIHGLIERQTEQTMAALQRKLGEIREAITNQEAEIARLRFENEQLRAALEAKKNPRPEDEG